MPLFPGKKNIARNIKKEMKAGKPHLQSIAIAMDVARRKPKKKMMAEGGAISAADEKRPMPEEKANDSKTVMQNSSKKPLKDSDWSSRPDKRQTGPVKTMPLKHPKMVPQSIYTARLRDEEDELQQSAPPESPEMQPPMHDDEEDADKHGPDVPALHMKKMAKGGSVSGSVDEDEAENADLHEHVSMEMGEKPEEDRIEHPAHLEEDDDQMRPSMDKYMADHMEMLAEGGMAEEDEDHDASIAAAIMAKRRRMAEGGMINGMDSIETHEDEDQVDLKRNAEEDANMEDQLSFNALRKENYSESDALDKADSPMDSNEHGHEIDEDDHDEDMVSKIRSMMKRRSPIVR